MWKAVGLFSFLAFVLIPLTAFVFLLGVVCWWFLQEANSWEYGD